jgi:hypothetical protein
MAADKTKLMNEIEIKIQSLNLLLSIIKSDRSRKPEALAEYRKQYDQLLKGKMK